MSLRFPERPRAEPERQAPVQAEPIAAGIAAAPEPSPWNWPDEKVDRFVPLLRDGDIEVFPRATEAKTQDGNVPFGGLDGRPFHWRSDEARDPGQTFLHLDQAQIFEWGAGSR